MFNGGRCLAGPIGLFSVENLDWLVEYRRKKGDKNMRFIELVTSQSNLKKKVVITAVVCCVNDTLSLWCVSLTNRVSMSQGGQQANTKCSPIVDRKRERERGKKRSDVSFLSLRDSRFCLNGHRVYLRQGVINNVKRVRGEKREKSGWEERTSFICLAACCTVRV